MRSKPLHSKNTFIKFLSLAILVLGASVGVILATQKSTVFDESEAASYCAGAGQLCNFKDCCSGLEPDYYRGVCRCYGTECDFRSDSARYGNCINNKAVTCTQFGVKKTVDCDKVGGSCVPGPNSVTCSFTKPTQNPSIPNSPSTLAPIPAGYCKYDCSTRYECNNYGGTVVGGKCGTGEVCCNYGI
jgi:hypothetical protein